MNSHKDIFFSTERIHSGKELVKVKIILLSYLGSIWDYAVMLHEGRYVEPSAGLRLFRTMDVLSLLSTSIPYKDAHLFLHYPPTHTLMLTMLEGFQ